MSSHVPSSIRESYTCYIAVCQSCACTLETAALYDVGSTYVRADNRAMVLSEAPAG
jgi:hypothetical protein